MGRTTIEIDNDLVERVMRRYRLPTKRAAVDLAPRRLAGEPMSLPRPVRPRRWRGGGGRSARRHRA